MVESREGIEEQTGTGAPRSSEGRVSSPSTVEGEDMPDNDVNRSGSGGTGEGEERVPESNEEALGE